MNIVFDKVRLHNFLSFKDAELDLDNRGFVLVEGTNNNKSDNAKSNGSGKSSLFEAVVWALTGETVRGTKTVKNMLASKNEGCYVDLTFSVDNVKYRVVRYREDDTYGNNLKLYVDDKDVSGKGIRETQAVLDKYLPDVNLQFIGSVIILGQGLPQRFTNNTPSGRKELLEQLSKTDYMIADITARLQKRAETLNELYSKTNVFIAELNYKIESSNDAIQRNNAEITNLQRGSKEDELVVINKEIATYSELISKKEELIEQYKAEQDRLNSELEEHKKREAECKQLENTYYDAMNVVNTELTEHDKEITAVDVEIKHQKQEITNLENVQTVCPTCHRPFDGVFVPDTTAQRNNLFALESKKTELLTKRQEIYDRLTEAKTAWMNARRGSEDASNVVRDVYNSIQKNGTIIQGYQNEIRNYTSQQTIWEKKKSEIEERYKQIAQRIEDLRKNNEELVNSIEMCKSGLEQRQNSLEDVVSRQDAVKKIQSYCSREFRGFLLEDCINFVCERTKFYARYMFGHDNVDFVLSANTITIQFNGKDYESLSGGERQKVDLIIQFSLRDMLLTTVGFSCNVLCTDELFDNLDSVGCDNLINMIMQTMQDISSVFIITHHADIGVPYDRKISVIKEPDGYSYIS